MGYKDALGTEGEVYVFSEEIDAYFKGLGFYESDMNPRFMNGYDYDKITTHDAPVLRFDGDWDWDGNGVQRVFMNEREVYVERQTSYRSFDSGEYHKFKFDDEPTIEEIERVLDEIVREYED
jgi:hypothetical protein